MEWLGRARIAFHASPTPLVMRERGDATDTTTTTTTTGGNIPQEEEEEQQKKGKETDFLSICQQVVPPCQLNPLLFNGHAQTMWTTVSPAAPEVHYLRRVFRSERRAFPGSFTVDFVVGKEAWEEGMKSGTGTTAAADGADGDGNGVSVSAEEMRRRTTVNEAGGPLPPRTANFSAEEEDEAGPGPTPLLRSDDSRPMLVILHGLSGGSHEVYLRHAVWPLLSSGSWEACVVNSRGCANSKITTGILYNARATWDLRQTVLWLRGRFPNRPLFGLGFSLGACILTNYLGEEGEGCPLRAAVACANPWNLDVSGKALRRTWIGHEVYQRALGSSMRRLTAQHRAEIGRYTDVDYDALQRLTYLYEFDRAYQCPTWGYPTEEAYYRDASSIDSVMSVRVPLLAINALDDPISNWQALPRGECAANPYTVLCTTSLGGHLGWFEVGGSRWNTKPITNFFNHMAFKVDLDSIRPPPEVTERHHNNKMTNGDWRPTHYDAMRRRMHFDLEA